MTSENDDLITSEGVDEGSADSTAESAEGSEGAAGVTGALGAASESGRPKGEYDPAPPLDAGLPMTGTDRDDQVGPGQELTAGEG
jgi:hypothetical protein